MGNGFGRQRTTQRLSRRQVLGWTAAIAGVAALGQPERAAAQSAPHVATLGDATITVISDGGMSLPMSYALPATDAKTADALLAPRGLAADAYAMQVNVTVIKTPDALIVVDSGGGGDFVPTLGQFADRLEQAGVRAPDVTHVVFTHGHPDHFWGLIDPFEDDTRFPNARHVMSAAERDHWLQPGLESRLPDAMKGLAIGTARRLKAVEKRIDPVKPGGEIIAGVSMLATPGHTPGHSSILVNRGGQSLLIGGDVLSHPVISFERPDWVWGPDLDPQQATATRRKVLDQLATDRTQLLGYHLPWPGLGRVERKDNGYRFVAG